jgi:DtxR family Mn-dependent transcriptional regulator
VRSVVGDYLEATYSLQAEGHEVHAITLAGLFGVSRAAASATVNRLERDGLIANTRRSVALTDTGRVRAEEGIRRHCLTERFLVDVLGVDWTEVHDQARQFERGLTPLVEEHIDRRLAKPSFCPHGNPIPRPGFDAATYFRSRQAFVLASAPIAARLRVLAVSELAEHRPEWMRTYGALGLRPQAIVRLSARAAKHVELQVDQQPETASLDSTLAAWVWVVREEDEH